MRDWPRLLRSLLTCSALAMSVAGCSTKAKQPVGETCQANSDCSDGGICASGTCQQPPPASCGTDSVCQRDSDCPSQQCNTDTGCCQAPCTDSSACNDTQICIHGVCQTEGAGCQTNADCPHVSAPICDMDAGVCVRCTASNECDPGEQCQNDVCTGSVTTCTMDADCTVPGLPHCDTSVAGGRCVACNTAADCPMGDSCPNHFCLEPMTGCVWDGDCTRNPAGQYCANDGTCVACLTNDNCPIGSVCTAQHKCSSATSCVSDANCPSSAPHCRPSDHFCAECATAPQCPLGQVCRNGNCEAAVNGCLSNADCRPPLAVCETSTRQCIGCNTNDDCGAFCVGGMCQPCMTDLDCDEAFLLEGRIYCDGNHACVQCVSTVQCSDGQVCGPTGACIADPTNGPCPSSGTCGLNANNDPIVCVQDGTPTGTCRAPCDPYNPNCGSGLFCGVTGYAAGTVSGACVPAPSGSASVGSACSASVPCDPGAICLPNGPHSSACYALCDPSSSNTDCGPPKVCDGVVQIVSGHVPVTVGACLPSGKFTQGCTSASSCSSGQVCAAEGNPGDPTTLFDACWWPLGTGGPGAGCSHGTDCQSGTCLIAMPQNQGYPGFCQGGCSSDSMCPARQDGYAGACEPFPAPWYDASGHPITTDVITCVAQCRDDSECASGETCDVVEDAAGAGWATRCVNTNSTSQNLGGAVCVSDSDCFSNHCLNIGMTTGGICAGACNPANGGSDCNSGSGCPQGGVSLLLPGTNTYAAAPICWTKPCTANIQCGPAGVCDGDVDPQNPNDIVLYCHPKQGSAGGGGSCNLNSDCQSDFCVNWAGGNGCFGVCNPANGNGDCAAGATCHTGDWPGTTHMLSYCIP